MGVNPLEVGSWRQTSLPDQSEIGNTPTYRYRDLAEVLQQAQEFNGDRSDVRRALSQDDIYSIVARHPKEKRQLQTPEVCKILEDRWR